MLHEKVTKWVITEEILHQYSETKIGGIMAWNMSNPHIKNLTLNAMTLTKSNNSDFIVMNLLTMKKNIT